MLMQVYVTTVLCVAGATSSLLGSYGSVLSATAMSSVLSAMAKASTA